MNSSYLLLGAIVVFYLGYRLYGRLLNRTYQIDDAHKTPAHTRYDGRDFVPAKNWFVLFGHHFSSICGAGPVVGPVLAIAYWGWAPSLIWILLGTILLGAVADYSSLVMSVRHGGESIAEIARPAISARARLLFSWFIWLAVILIIAVFALFGAKTFVEEGQAVLPSMGLIPTAVLTGFLLYRVRQGMLWGSVLGLSILVALLLLGHAYPLALPALGAISPLNLWIIILLIYCVIASVTPVTWLLQPRDYLAAYLLFFTIIVGLAGIVYVQPTMQPVSYHAWNPVADWPDSGGLVPMLFVTIACGAISGFHSLVSSGTTCKQLDRETHACRIGYGGMLVEGLVGVLVLICVGAALSADELSQTLRRAGPIAVFSEGFSRVTTVFLGDYGKPFAVLALNTFILTTLDSATRIARYLTMDLFHIRNKYFSTMLVVLVSGMLALTGKWQIIWPIFGTANQLIAGLALLVASCWLLNRGRPSLITLIPAILMLVITTWAFVLQIFHALTRAVPNYLIAGICAVLIALSFIVFIEAMGVLRSKSHEQQR